MKGIVEDTKNVPCRVLITNYSLKHNYAKKWKKVHHLKLYSKLVVPT